jgi:SAM-dependent methyltransferase
MEASTHHPCICGQEVAPSPFSEHFNVLACQRCGTQQFHARPGIKPPQFKYDSDSGKYAQDDYLFGCQLRWSHKQLMQQDWSGRKVLEIGCFNGFFLNELRSLGAEVYGFDVNSAALEAGRKLFGLDGRIQDSLDALKAFAPFDDVICIDVIEHLDRPDQFLFQMLALLSPDGRILVAGPTVERRFFDKSDYPPHHKWRFSRAGLTRCLESAGYAVERVDIQYDGLLMLRNFLGKLLHGLRKKEFYGDVRIAAPSMDGKMSSRLYEWMSVAGQWLFRRLGIAYCSTILVAKQKSPS